jgi:dTDP-4-dehydrorhamnose 3,5-epimerase
MGNICSSFFTDGTTMAYTIIETGLAGVVLLEPKLFGDDRGFFMESFNARDFALATGVDAAFVQDNHSRSERGVVRGLHFQVRQPQGKLVRVVSGSVFDVAVDVRRSSPTFGRWFGAELSATNHRQLWIPEGFAHGFVVTSETADFLYKTTDYWAPEHERCIRWNDPAIGIDWPQTDAPKLSERDAGAGLLADAEIFD